MIEYTLGFIYSNDHKQVLLIRRGKHEFHTNKSNGLGGKILIGESPKACIVREVFEEAEIKTREDDWMFIGVLSSPDWKVWIFSTTIDNSSFKGKQSEEGEVQWQNCNALPNNIVSNLNWLIPFCLDKLENPQLSSLVAWYTQSKGE